ncbi:MAG: peptide MFS transporter [Gemmatimonadaceae bacterium]
MSAAIDIAATATDRPSALDDRALFGHPRGLGLLFITEMWERFSYYGMRGILILYLVNALKWDIARAANLYGTYTMLVFLTPLIGGYLADRFIGTRRSLVIGGAIIALGHFSLAFPGMPMFYVGLALIIIGTGFFKPNVSTMVGQIYPDGDARRDAGFTIFYVGINTGAFLGPIVCGYLAQTPGFGWHYGFAAAGIGMVLGLLVYVFFRDRYLPGIGINQVTPNHGPDSRAAATVGSADAETLKNGIIGGVAGAALGWFGGGLLGLVMGLTIGAALAITVLGSHGEERRRVIAIFIVVVFVIFFWAAYEQAGSSMNLFADKNTDLNILGADRPSSWFQAVNPFYIIAFAPVFAWLWGFLARRGKEPSTALKMALGLFLVGLGFVFMVIGGGRADSGVLVSPIWLLFAYLLHTWGELCLSPVGLSYVTKVAPLRFASLLMGVWFLANAAANKIGGALAAFTPTPGQARGPARTGIAAWIQSTSMTNHGFYMIFLVASFIAATVLLLFVPLLKRLTSTVRA